MSEISLVSIAAFGETFEAPVRRRQQYSVSSVSRDENN